MKAHAAHMPYVTVGLTTCECKDDLTLLKREHEPVEQDWSQLSALSVNTPFAEIRKLLGLMSRCRTQRL